MKKKTFAPLVAGFSLMALGSASALAAVTEAEPNNQTSQAQEISIPYGNATVNAMMGVTGNTTHKDVDFYKVNAKAGETLTFDIDNGYSGTAQLDTLITVYGPAPEYEVLRMVRYASDTDEGSISTLDARVDDFVAPEDGVYTIGVGAVPVFFFEGGYTFAFESDVVKNYDLVIGGASAVPSVQMINIEVKPGSGELAPINPRSRGKVPVAILGSLNFSVVSIDTDTLTFGATGDEDSLFKCAKSAEDVNDDGHYDLVCHFENQAAGFSYSSLEGVLKGETESGEKFEGQAYLKVHPNHGK